MFNKYQQIKKWACQLDVLKTKSVYMKRILVLSLSLFVYIILCAQNVTYNFDSYYECQFAFLDSVVIENLSNGTDTVIYYPDNNIEFVFSGISDLNRETDNFKIYQNYPNPFEDYTTIDIAVSQIDKYTLVVTDITGRELEYKELTLMKGNHQFSFSSGIPGTYILGVYNKYHYDYIQMISYGSGIANLFKLKYHGIAQNAVLAPKTKAEKTSFMYAIGDPLLFTGYINGYSEQISDSPLESEEYVFYFIDSLPDSPTLFNSSTGFDNIEWIWNSVENANGYKVSFDNYPGSAIDIGSDTTYFANNLNCGQNYNLYVWAYNDCGRAQVVSFLGTTTDCPLIQECGEDLFYHGCYYETVQIGEQCWFAENLKYDNGCGSVEWDSGVNNGWCGYYEDNSVAYADYGMLYQWSAIINEDSVLDIINYPVQGICPNGWFVPSELDWDVLENYLIENGYNYDGTVEDNKIAKSLASDVYWIYSEDEGTIGNNLSLNNTSGFNALPAGNSYTSDYDFNRRAYWWTSSKSLSYTGKVGSRELYYNDVSLHSSYDYKSYLHSVRCVRGADQTDLKPTVLTLYPEELSYSRVTLLGGILSDGGDDVYSQGFILSKTDSAILQTYEQILYCDDINNFSFDVESISPDETYFFIAFAINGAGISYGEIIEFSTLRYLPCSGMEEVVYHDYTYPTIKVGDQCWFAENLRYLPAVNTTFQNNSTEPCYYVYDDPSSDVELAMSSENYETFGVLYNFISALDACPEGWHLPSVNDWYTFNSTLINDGFNYDNTYTYDKVAKALADSTTWTYSDLYTGGGDPGRYLELNNLSGFNGAAGGYVDNTNFKNINKGAYWWAVDTDEGDQGKVYLYFKEADLDVHTDDYNTTKAQYIRCISDNSTLTDKAEVEIVEIFNVLETSALCRSEIISDGGTTIFERGIVWSETGIPSFSSYLGKIDYEFEHDEFVLCLNDLEPNQTYYIRAYAFNSEGIAYSQPDTLTTLEFDVDAFSCDGLETLEYGGYDYDLVRVGRQCWFAENLRYDNSCSTIDWINSTDTGWCGYFSDNDSTYGYLYQYSAALDACPEGWHLSTDDDWKEMEMFFGMSLEEANDDGNRGTNQGSKLAGYLHLWNIDDLVEDHEAGTSRFNCIPGGKKIASGSIVNIERSAYFWITEGNEIGNRSISSFNTGVYRSFEGDIVGANSVRCIKDSYLVDSNLTVFSDSVNNIFPTYARAYGHFENNGESLVDARGFVWDTLPAPNHGRKMGVKNLSGSNLDFNGYFSGLIPGKTYYIRAFTLSDVGCMYGDEIIFNTPNFTDCGQVTYEGYTYNTVVIGEQCWFAENLRYLPEVSPRTEYSDTLPYYYVYDYTGTDTAEAKLTDNYNIYGALYNYTAATEACPPGWHTPSYSDWSIMERSICLSASCETSFPLNYSPSWHGTIEASCLAGNEQYWLDGELDNNFYFESKGFNALPAGGNSYSGYYGLGEHAYYWNVDTLLVSQESDVYFRRISYNDTRIYSEQDIRKDMKSVRCMKSVANSVIQPSVVTNTPYDISEFSAKVDFEVSNDGAEKIYSIGLIWSKSSSVLDMENYQDYAVLGEDIGAYTYQFVALIPDTTYYIRAFALSSEGIYYGEVQSFTTDEVTACVGDELVDYEGYQYSTVQIGNQCWFAENLRYLPLVSGYTTYDYVAPHYYVYGYLGTDVTEAKATVTYENYGVLYNWGAAMNGDDPNNPGVNGIQGICPDGWHIPDLNEWKELKMVLGISETEANIMSYNDGPQGSLLAGNSSLWLDGILENNDSFGTIGFNALPGGYVGYGNIYDESEIGEWWSATPSSSSSSFYFKIRYDFTGVIHHYTQQRSGLSIRCLRD